jgi:hypothetical protein
MIMNIYYTCVDIYCATLGTEKGEVCRAAPRPREELTLYLMLEGHLVDRNFFLEDLSVSFKIVN